MSNALAIATVTAALGKLVHGAAEAGVVGGVKMNFDRPTAPGSAETVRKVHIYLYQVSPNAALRNNDLPARSSDGRFQNRPQVALNLHYLVAFYGDQSKLEPERMMGAVVRNLHAYPVLSKQAINDAINDSQFDLTQSDLADSIERVRFTPAVISLDELSKLWSVFFQTPHAPSIAYEASVVLIEGDDAAQPSLPVLKRGTSDQGVDTLLGPFPLIETVYFGMPGDKILQPRPLSLPAAKLGLSVILSGHNLGGDATRICFQHSKLDLSRELQVASADVSAGELKVCLPMPGSGTSQTDWAPGVYTVSVAEERPGTSRELTSNALPVALSPIIASILPGNTIARDASGTATVSIICQPRVHPGQKAVLVVAGLEITGQIDPAGPDKVIFSINDAPAMSDELVRLRVDGIESMPYKRIDDPPPTRFEFDSSQRITIT